MAANIYRDKVISEITEKDVGSRIRACGWIENIRDHGGVSFIDLRDMYGVLQVVMRDTTLLDGLVKEDCISVEGIIDHRDEETYNPKIASGTIELDCKSVDVLGKVRSQLPFEIMTSKEIREDVRLKYRYLDLRNKKVKDKDHPKEFRTATILASRGYRCTFWDDELKVETVPQLGDIIAGRADLDTGIEIKTMDDAAGYSSFDRYARRTKKKAGVSLLVFDVSENQHLTDEDAAAYIARALKARRYPYGRHWSCQSSRLHVS